MPGEMINPLGRTASRSARPCTGTEVSTASGNRNLRKKRCGMCTMKPSCTMSTTCLKACARRMKTPHRPPFELMTVSIAATDAGEGTMRIRSARLGNCGSASSAPSRALRRTSPRKTTVSGRKRPETARTACRLPHTGRAIPHDFQSNVSVAEPFPSAITGSAILIAPPPKVRSGTPGMSRPATSSRRMASAYAPTWCSPNGPMVAVTLSCVWMSKPTRWSFTSLNQPLAASLTIERTKEVGTPSSTSPCGWPMNGPLVSAVDQSRSRSASRSTVSFAMSAATVAASGRGVSTRKRHAMAPSPSVSSATAPPTVRQRVTGRSRA